MRGHLQHRGGDAWRIKVYLGRSPDGRRRYLERTVRGSRRDAERELARTLLQVPLRGTCWLSRWPLLLTHGGGLHGLAVLDGTDFCAGSGPSRGLLRHEQRPSPHPHRRDGGQPFDRTG